VKQLQAEAICDRNMEARHTFVCLTNFLQWNIDCATSNYRWASSLVLFVCCPVCKVSGPCSNCDGRRAFACSFCVEITLFCQSQLKLIHFMIRQRLDCLFSRIDRDYSEAYEIFPSIDYFKFQVIKHHALLARAQHRGPRGKPSILLSVEISQWLQFS
jgi:hypothetical protein